RRRRGRLSVRAVRLRTRRSAVPHLRHAADRYPPDRRAHHGVLPSVPAVSRARARARALGLPLPAADLAQLRAKVRALAENRPGTYRMLDATGAILYVGKAKRVRTRLLSYFRAEYPAEKASRILHASHDIEWDYTPSEFSAYLSELRQIRRYRPRFNVTLNRTRRSVLIKVGGGPAPRVYVGAGVVPGDLRAYGPFRS